MEGAPTTGHVSRTLRVALDRLFDRCKLDAGIHIQFADTTRQIADVLPESSFAREQRDRQIGVSNIKDEATSSCSHSRSLRVQLDESISERQTEQEEEARSAGKSRPVRNPYAFKPHSASSSSRSGVHTLFVPVGRNPEPMKIQLNCDVETSQDSDFDKICLVKHREIGGDIVQRVRELKFDPPTNQLTKWNAESSSSSDRKQEVRKIQLSALSVPCQSSPLGNLHDFLLYVCTVHLSGNGDQL